MAEGSGPRLGLLWPPEGRGQLPTGLRHMARLTTGLGGYPESVEGFRHPLWVVSGGVSRPGGPCPLLSARRSGGRPTRRAGPQQGRGWAGASGSFPPLPAPAPGEHQSAGNQLGPQSLGQPGVCGPGVSVGVPCVHTGAGEGGGTPVHTHPSTGTAHTWARGRRACVHVHTTGLPRGRVLHRGKSSRTRAGPGHTSPRACCLHA